MILPQWQQHPLFLKLKLLSLFCLPFYEEIVSLLLLLWLSEMLRRDCLGHAGVLGAARDELNGQYDGQQMR